MLLFLLFLLHSFLLLLLLLLLLPTSLLFFINNKATTLTGQLVASSSSSSISFLSPRLSSPCIKFHSSPPLHKNVHVFVDNFYPFPRVHLLLRPLNCSSSSATFVTFSLFMSSFWSLSLSPSHLTITAVHLACSFIFIITVVTWTFVYLSLSR